MELRKDEKQWKEAVKAVGAGRFGHYVDAVEITLPGHSSSLFVPCLPTMFGRQLQQSHTLAHDFFRVFPRGTSFAKADLARSHRRGHRFESCAAHSSFRSGFLDRFTCRRSAAPSGDFGSNKKAETPFPV